MRERPPLRWIARVLRVLLPPLLTAVLLALLGPFGTHASQSLPQRLGFWSMAVAGNWLLCHLAILWLEQLWLSPKSPVRGASAHLRRLALPLLAALLVLLPATALVKLAGDTFGGLGAASLPSLALQVYLICAAISLIGYNLIDMAEEARTARNAQETATAEASSDGRNPILPPPDSLFRQRLAADDPGGPLLWLRAEDHYLRVRTEGGEALILCRLEDAARELGDCGQRVHRSWWVAEDAVRGSSAGTTPHLTLADGTQVPVSRSYRADLRDRGWIPSRRRA